ncbi:MAG: MFS transporter [Candidatus Lokiarchaeota archaeon]|nr:MFS transporter [Candidatus Lokiarchaeota archaeon]
MADRKFLNEEEHADHLRNYSIDPRKAMFTIILSILVDVFGYSMVLPLLPFIVADWGQPDLFVGILISSNALSAFIFGPIWGKLSDKYGRKPILLISQAGTGISFLILALSPNVYVILFSRILDGIFGGQIPVIRAYISDITTPATRASQMGKLMIGHTGGMIFGPIVGGVLGALNWRYPALFAVILSIIAMVLTLRVLIESMPKNRISDLKLRIINRESSSEKKRKIFTREIVGRFVQVFLLFFITVMFNSSMALVLLKRYGATEIIIGLVMTLAGVTILIYGGFLMKPLFKKVGEKKVLLIASILLIVNFLAFPFMTELWMILILIPSFVFSMVFLPSLIQSNITKAVDDDKQGVVSGMTTNVQSIAQIISPLIATGFIQIGGLSIGMIFLNPYELIGYLAVILGIGLFIILYFDLKRHSYLYSYEKPRNKSKAATKLSLENSI